MILIRTMHIVTGKVQYFFIDDVSTPWHYQIPLNYFID